MIAPQPNAARFSLKKLPMWGKLVRDEQIDFEWPTEQVLDMWDADVTLKSIEFKTWIDDGSAISSVQVKLTNGRESPVFEKAGVETFCAKTIAFDQHRPIKTVEAIEGAAKQTYWISFLDENCDVVDEYNPQSIELCSYHK